MRHRLNNPNYKAWTYVHSSKRSMTSSTKLVVVGNTYYINVSMAAAKEASIPASSVRKRIYSKNFPDWQWCGETKTK